MFTSRSLIPVSAERLETFAASPCTLSRRVGTGLEQRGINEFETLDRAPAPHEGHNLHSRCKGTVDAMTGPRTYPPSFRAVKPNGNHVREMHRLAQKRRSAPNTASMFVCGLMPPRAAYKPGFTIWTHFSSVPGWRVAPKRPSHPCCPFAMGDRGRARGASAADPASLRRSPPRHHLAGGRLDSPRDHVGCHVSRSMRPRICQKRLPVK